MNIVLIILGILLGLGILFFLIGFSAPKTFEGTLSVQLNTTLQTVWDYLSDIEDLPNRRREITKVERLGTNDVGLAVWKEHTDMKGYIIFELLEEIPLQRKVMRMRESTFGMAGTWTYDLESIDGGVQVTIHEKSQIDKVFIRTMLTLAGRNANLRKEAQLLNKAFSNA